MKNVLPQNHGLSDEVVRELVFGGQEAPSLTDAQFDALTAGLGRGESVIVVSPTSTGKTHIALWAIAAALVRGDGAVYLVTHRALARQKFEDFRRDLLPFVSGDPTALIMATGDEVQDASSQARTDPLAARVLIATYEKYLALLCGAGLPKSLRSTVVVCDEVQLVGDLHRGRDVEILLTLIRNARCRQLIGLSAVLDPSSARGLAEWLGVTLVSQPVREKHLQYECWTPNGVFVRTTDLHDAAEVRHAAPTGVGLDVLAILQHILAEAHPQKPIIVFCMRKADTYSLAKRFAPLRHKVTTGAPSKQMSLIFEDLPQTSANELLASILESRIAVHSADLTEPERRIVERMLAEGKLDVVFATSTLAAGVNFPFGTALFAAWTRWDSSRGARIPIEPGEFHNMAGRVGRMGFEHGRGRVVFTADRREESQARRYLDVDRLTVLEPRIEPLRFGQIALQLVSSNLCRNRRSVEEIICGTFSGLSEARRNLSGLVSWKTALGRALDSLVSEGLLADLGDGQLSTTKFGKAVAQSGLLPETGVYLLRYLSRSAEHLSSLLPKRTHAGSADRLARVLFAICLQSPEFRPIAGHQGTRHLPYPLDKTIVPRTQDFGDDFTSATVQADPAPFNGAQLCLEWINGEELRLLEMSAPDLTAGMLRDLFRDLSWVLNGMAAVAAAGADSRVPLDGRPKALGQFADNLYALSTLPRTIRRLVARIVDGLPDEVEWMSRLEHINPAYRLSRNEILQLRAAEYGTPERLMLGTAAADSARCQVFARARPAPQVKSNWLRDTCREWKLVQRQQACERQMSRAAQCQQRDTIARFHAAVGKDFELAFEEALRTLQIPFDKLDDGQVTGAPDYLIAFADSPPLIVELKSRSGMSLVGYNGAVEVLSASEVHGHKDVFCVTLCHPGVDPAVAPVITECRRLCVVESADFAEALLRHCQGNLSQAELWQWLATPGQALVTDLFFTSRPQGRRGLDP